MASGNLSAAPLATRSESISMGQIVRSGLVAIVGSIVANLIVLAIVRPLGVVPSDFLPLQIGPIVIFTFVGVAAAVIVFARVAKQPLHTYRRIALIAMLVSLIPNVAFALNPGAAGPAPGVTPLGFLSLMIFHVVAWAITVRTLTGRVVN